MLATAMRRRRLAGRIASAAQVLSWVFSGVAAFSCTGVARDGTFTSAHWPAARSSA
jgi:hypothetical protein